MVEIWKFGVSIYFLDIGQCPGIGENGEELSKDKLIKHDTNLQTSEGHRLAFIPFQLLYYILLRT